MNIPIVIDNGNSTFKCTCSCLTILDFQKMFIAYTEGSYKCRAGFAGEGIPRLVFRNQLARLRKEKGKNKVVSL